MLIDILLDYDQPPERIRQAGVSAMIEAFFDYRSPYAYLANQGLQRIGAPFETTLIDIGWVMQEVKNQPSPMCPPKLKYTWVDSARSAANDGVPFAVNQALLGAVRGGVLPAQFLLRAGIAAQRLGCDLAFNNAMFHALWAGAADLTTEGARASLLMEHGIDAPTLWADASEEWTGKALDANNARAVERDVFGVPTIFVDDEMFFGNDRMDMIRKRIATKVAA